MKSDTSPLAFDRPAPAPTERTVTLLGATGSIGTSTIDLLKRERARFRVEAVSANRNAEALAALAELVEAGVGRRQAADLVSRLTGTSRNRLYRGSL